VTGDARRDPIPASNPVRVPHSEFPTPLLRISPARHILMINITLAL